MQTSYQTPTELDAGWYAEILGSVTNNVPIPMLLIDVRKRVVTRSPQWSEHFGSVDDTSDFGFSDTIVEMDRLSDVVGAVLADGATRNAVFAVQQRNTQQLFDFRVDPLRHSGGSIDGVTIVASDIGRRTRGEAELTALHRRLNLALAAINAGMWDWYVQEDRVVWDEQMQRLYGLQERRFSGSMASWLSAVHPDSRDAVLNKLVTALVKQQKLITEFTIVRPDGEQRIIRCFGELELDDEGDPIRMTGVNWDVTECRRAPDGSVHPAT